MSILTNHMLMAAAGAQGGALDVADVFSTDLWTGASAAVTVTNGVNLAGPGGMVWGKRRDGPGNNWINDTVRNAGKLYTNSDQQQYAGPEVASYNSDGFTTTSTLSNDVNYAGMTYAAWTFRKAPKFFDVVTYTGNGAAGRTIAHNLGIEPGMIVVKRQDNAASWYVYNRRYPSASGQMESRSAFTANALGGATDTDFTTGSFVEAWNAFGGTYVAYLFAHDPSPEGFIQCGSYTGNGSSGGKSVSLGWEPQYLMVKRTDASSDWWVWDNKRSPVNPRRKVILPNDNDPESDHSDYEISFDATGFTILASDPGTPNASFGDYIYMAVRSEGV